MSKFEGQFWALVFWVFVAVAICTCSAENSK
jgi:hypothetical protein